MKVQLKEQEYECALWEWGYEDGILLPDRTPDERFVLVRKNDWRWGKSYEELKALPDAYPVLLDKYSGDCIKIEPGDYVLLDTATYTTSLCKACDFADRYIVLADDKQDVTVEENLNYSSEEETTIDNTAESWDKQVADRLDLLERDLGYLTQVCDARAEHIELVFAGIADRLRALEEIKDKAEGTRNWYAKMQDWSIKVEDRLNKLEHVVDSRTLTKEPYTDAAGADKGYVWTERPFTVSHKAVIGIHVGAEPDGPPPDHPCEHVRFRKDEKRIIEVCAEVVASAMDKRSGVQPTSNISYWQALFTSAVADDMKEPVR